MEHRKTIFLSYRRDDNPGYVRQLQEDLQRTFGKDSVFRDVEDITGGASWKQVLEDSLADSAALIVVIGSRWEQIWKERNDKSGDYIVYELNYANERGIPIIPVTVDGATLSGGIELGRLSWLMDKQFYDISDKQGRWSTDVDGLVALLQRLPGLQPVNPEETETAGSARKWAWIPVLAVAAGLLFYQKSDLKNETSSSSDQNPVEEPNAIPATELDLEPVKQLYVEIVEKLDSEPATARETGAQFPDVSGTWVAKDGDTFQFGSVVNGRFIVRYQDAEGEGIYIPNMPRKFTIEIDGIGKGEYSYSNDNVTIHGKFLRSGSYEPERKKFRLQQ